LNELLDQFIDSAIPAEHWPTKPATVGNMLRLAIQYGWLKSAVPFGKTLTGPDSVWKESLVLTDSGRKAIGHTDQPTRKGE
jgi:hypothetical protein